MADSKTCKCKRKANSGPEEKGGSVKTKTVSSSTASGDSLRKRSADEIGLEDESKSKPAPSKISKLGFSMTAKKPTPITIKLGASWIYTFLKLSILDFIVS
uniref:PEST proteolytic signal-containing nuclear protein n=1 Tax=Sinocyclocheilus rhinocerous TaxID=307959 RepID=A0A673M013_9TELE